MVKTGIAVQFRRPRDAAMVSEDSDISEISNSRYRSCRQNISDRCMALTCQSTPCGRTRPASIGSVIGFRETARLSDRSVMVAPGDRSSGHWPWRDLPRLRDEPSHCVPLVDDNQMT